MTALEPHALSVGLRGARCAAFEAIGRAISRGCFDHGDSETIDLIMEITERSYRAGVEAKADSVLPRFAAMSEQIDDLKAQLHGRPVR